MGGETDQITEQINEGAGDRMKVWGKLGGYWGGLWALLRPGRCGDHAIGLRWRPPVPAPCGTVPSVRTRGLHEGGWPCYAASST